MGLGLEIEIRNAKLKEHVRIERSENEYKLTVSPFPFREILVEGKNLKGRLLARFSNLDGITPNLNAILRAIETICEFDNVKIIIGTFYELDIDKKRGLVVATGLADMRKKTFRLADIQRLQLGEIWRKIYQF
ncbi:MAG: hypothetical protein Q6363_009830 [Candidatus Njordarchaeota archaeon]